MAALQLATNADITDSVEFIRWMYGESANDAELAASTEADLRARGFWAEAERVAAALELERPEAAPRAKPLSVPPGGGGLRQFALALTDLLVADLLRHPPGSV